MISLRVTNDSVALTRVHLPSEETKSFSKRGVIRQRQYPSCIPVSLYPQRYARIVPSLVSRLVEFSAICSSSIRLGTRRAVNVVLWPAAYSGKTKKKKRLTTFLTLTLSRATLPLSYLFSFHYLAHRVWTARFFCFCRSSVTRPQLVYPSKRNNSLGNGTHRSGMQEYSRLMFQSHMTISDCQRITASIMKNKKICFFLLL